MDLQVHHLIVHQLRKEADATEATLELADALQPLSERTQWLAEQLDNAFMSKAEVLQAFLSPPEDALFPGYFREWLEQDSDPKAFVDFSRHTMQALQQILQSVIGAKGGYLIYMDYTRLHVRQLGIFLVRDTEGLVFKPTSDAARFDLNTVTYLHVDKLALACRIRIDAFRQGEGRYVDMIKHAKSQKAISEYFINWIGLDQAQSSKALTRTFLEVVNHLPLPVDEDTGQPLSEDAFREQVLHFALESPQRTIELERFDKTFYADQQPTRTYLEENDIALDEQFRFDDTTLRKHYNSRIYAQGIAVSFNRGHLQARQIEVEGDSIVIRSPELVEKLLELMEQ